MAFKALYGLCRKLACALTATSTTLRLAEEQAGEFCAALGTNNHTWLVLSNGVAHEVVRATCVSGTINIERGQDDTVARAWDSCDTAKFDWVPSAMRDQMLAATAGGETQFICGVVSDTLNVTQLTEPEDCDCKPSCTLRIETKPCDPVSFRAGNDTVRFENGCVSVTPVAASQRLAPGTYKCATVVVGADGYITAVTEGDCVTRVSCSPCCG